MAYIETRTVGNVTYDIHDAKLRDDIASTEETSTATATHTEGSYFIYNDILYRATANIAIGDTIASGTNCTAVTVGGELVGKLNSSNVYNGLDKSVSGFALDARQGKALNDKINSASAYGEVGPVAIASIQDALPLNAESLVVDIEPVQSGSGDPSPSNVRPISGWTGAKVTRTGKNLLKLVESEMVSSGWNRSFPINVKAGTYIISCRNQFGASSSFGARTILTDSDNNTVVVLPYNNYGFGNTVFSGPATTITEEQAKLIKNIVFECRAGGVTASDITRGNIQLELGSTATDYEPYQGDIYDITFPSEAGTVYGGTLDVVNGVLTVDRGNIASYAGETLHGAWISSMDVYTDGGMPTTGAQVVYELATPITYQLTPQQVAMLQGNNTVFADCGDTTVCFWRDDSLSINKAITERAYDRQQGEALAGKLDATQSDIAIIIDGNKTTHTGGVAVGEYVIVRNSTISGITDGLYTAAQAIPANTAIDSTYLTAVDGGGLNAVNKQFGNYALKNWIRKPGTVSGTTAMGIPSDANEIYVQVQTGVDGIILSTVIPMQSLTSETYIYAMPGGYYDSSNYLWVSLNINKSSVAMRVINENGTIVTNTSFLAIWYR